MDSGIEHRILRQKLHQTFTKLSGKDRIKELILTNMNQAMAEIDKTVAQNVSFICYKPYISSYLLRQKY